MANYYCMMAGLPDITLDSPMSVSFPEIREEMEMTLNDDDKRIIFYFFLENDCKNLVRLLKNPDAAIDPNCNYTMDQYRDMITSAREMNFNVHRYPAFMSIFARNYNYNKDVKGWYAEDAMQLEFLKYAAECPNKMVREWYELNLNINNVLTAMIARKEGWNISDYIQGDNEVTEMIRNNNTKDFNLSLEYDYVKELMQIVECDDPVMKEKKIDAFKWTWLDDKTFFDVFSIEAVFAYLCKMQMLYRWQQLDPERGKETFKQIIENLRSEAKVPEEFRMKSPYNKEEGAYAK